MQLSTILKEKKGFYQPNIIKTLSQFSGIPTLVPTLVGKESTETPTDNPASVGNY